MTVERSDISGLCQKFSLLVFRSGQFGLLPVVGSRLDKTGLKMSERLDAPFSSIPAISELSTLMLWNEDVCSRARCFPEGNFFERWTARHLSSRCGMESRLGDQSQNGNVAKRDLTRGTMIKQFTNITKLYRYVNKIDG